MWRTRIADGPVSLAPACMKISETSRCGPGDEAAGEDRVAQLGPGDVAAERGAEVVEADARVG